MTSLALLLTSLIIGGNAIDGVDKNVCRLLSYTPDHKLINICSGTLLETRHSVATAAHCVAWMQKEKGYIKAECGFSGLDPKTKTKFQTTRLGTPVPVTGLLFSETRQSHHVYIHPDFRTTEKPSTQTPFDRAVVHLKSPMTSIEGVSLAKSQTELELSDCKIAGFGTAADGQTGFPHEATFDMGPTAIDVQDGALYFYSQKLITKSDFDAGVAKSKTADETEALVHAMKLGGFSALQLGGDSGGPLLCRVDGKPWRLLGIISGYSQAYADFSNLDAWKLIVANHFAFADPDTFFKGLVRANP